MANWVNKKREFHCHSLLRTKMRQPLRQRTFASSSPDLLGKTAVRINTMQGLFLWHTEHGVSYSHLEKMQTFVIRMLEMFLLAVQCI